jgi:hypothetical protein
MLCESFALILARDLRALQNQLREFTWEDDLWRAAPGLHNPAGNLALHLCGNLRHFVGAQLGGLAYVRDRDAEFAARGVPRAELLEQIDITIATVEQALAQLGDASLERPYPLEVADRPVTIGHFLIHLASHLGYHLGQVDAQRRMLAGPQAG